VQSLSSIADREKGNFDLLKEPELMEQIIGFVGGPAADFPSNNHFINYYHSFYCEVEKVINKLFFYCIGIVVSESFGYLQMWDE
jgi:hypothetical protein